MGILCHVVLLFYSLIFLSSASIIFSASDTLRENQVLENNQTLISSNNRFVLGFFVPNRANSNHTYLGIWYNNHRKTVVWVANRNNPIVGSQGRLSLSSNHFTVSYNNMSSHVLFVNASKAMTSPILRLLSNGNLVFVEEDRVNIEEDYAWQGFDYITDNLLPEMKLGWNLKTGHSTNLTSWSSNYDPSSGEFTFWLDSPNTPQLVLTRGTEKLYRWGPWDGVRFSGNSELKPNPVFSPFFISNGIEVYYSFKDDDDSTLSRFVVTQQGLIQYLVWSESEEDWTTFVNLQSDGCDNYGRCGPYGSCDKYPTCKCLRGFQPKSPEDWKKNVPTSGCERKWNLSCGNGDGFVKYKALKLPDMSSLGRNRSSSVEDCEDECLRNCSCSAYAWLTINNNGGNCLLWSGSLLDMRNFPNGEELYIRMARQELEAISDAKKRKRLKLALSIALPILLGSFLFGAFGCYIFRRRKEKVKERANRDVVSSHILHREYKQGILEDDVELQLFDLGVIAASTDEFSFTNKIGEGGFGPVYKGVFPWGQEFAVKRLSQNSGQGIQEFKNEVVLIKRLQHRNLVKLLGCCIHGEERMLVYEYLPNKSLDFILFDPNKQKLLTWKTRFDIITGIARGLLYLHQDARLRIIHRDLKASNILLDVNMNPKISDFGLARIFGGEQTQEKTKRVIGTYGYMSPEYALSGHFSVKSDVFSFGVLLLEIVSGKKNWGFYHPDHDLNLLGHAWKLWNEGNPLVLKDSEMVGPISTEEVIRCIKVGLWCVQQRLEDRPTMATVLFFLAEENTTVPEPKDPGFVTEASFFGTDTSSSAKIHQTTNNLTVTVLDGR